MRVVVSLATAFVIAGCAHSDRETSAPAQRKIVKVEKVRECTVTINAARVCSAPTTCKNIDTCAEAVFRLKTCGHQWLDGDRNGIPCQDKCGQGAKTMAERIAEAVLPASRI